MIFFLLSVWQEESVVQMLWEKVHSSLTGMEQMIEIVLMIKKIAYLTAVILITALPAAEAVYAADTGITVNNYITEPEKAFTAQDLRLILDRSLSVNETENVGKEDSSEKNGKEVEKKEGYPEGDTVSGDGADTEDEKNEGSEENGLFIPEEGDEWMLLLVNKQNPIPDDYAPELTDVNGSIKIRSEIALPLSEMFDDAEKDGVSLMVCSAYRSHEHQRELFDRKIRNYTGRGLSYLDAFRIGSYSVIIPGTSEHELGMALDIVTPGYMNLNEGFADTAAGKWLKDNAYKYGFILRYPKGKEYITGIIFEPWHYRYVGKEAAKIITQKDLTLEEYIEEMEYRYNNE